MIAELYRKRWTIETAFQESGGRRSKSEINTLGYPEGGVVCVLCRTWSHTTSRAPSKRAPCSVHGAAVVDTEFSTDMDLAEEVAATNRGMMIAIPEDEWVVFQGMSPRELSPLLRQFAAAVRLSEFRKQSARRSQEAATEADQRSQSKTRVDSQAAHDAKDQTGKESELVHKIQSTQGWVLHQLRHRRFPGRDDHRRRRVRRSL